MARSKKRSRTRCRQEVAAVQQLESRQLLTGNVTAVVQDGDLVLQGDSADNQFELTFFGGDVAVRTRGGTTVNGESGRFVAFPNTDTVPGKVVLKLGAGDDEVLVSRDIIVNGNMLVQTGAGNDTFGMVRPTLNGNLKVVMGSGRDGLALEGASIGGTTIVKGNNGKDSFAVTNSTLGAAARATMGGGDDNLLIDGVIAAAEVVIDSGMHNDVVAIGDADINGNLTLTTNTGNDVSQILDSRVEGATFIGMGADNDNLSLGAPGLRNVFVGDFVANGSGGANTYDQRNNVFKSERTVQRFTDGNVDLSALEAGVDKAVQVQNKVADIFVWKPQELEGTPDFSEMSVGAFVTRLGATALSGKTSNDALIEIDTDADGDFDDGAVRADGQGNYSIPITLVAGLQDISLRSSDDLGAVEILDFTIHRAMGSVARFQTSLGFFDVELLDDDAPLTVANYKNYFDAYENALIHRSVDHFVVQGGGFEWVDDQLQAIETNPAVENEFNPANSNVRGTLSTALQSGNPDSATNQWFINLKDNSNLDAAKHTVFGRVIADGMDIVDAIEALPVFNLDGNIFTETPLRNFEIFSEQLTGSLSTQSGSATVTGTGTFFTQELNRGQTLQIRKNGEVVGTYSVTSIQSDTELTLSDLVAETRNNAKGYYHETLGAQHFVFSDLDEILLFD